MRLLLLCVALVCVVSSPSRAQARQAAAGLPAHRRVAADSVGVVRSVLRVDSASHRRAPIVGGIVGSVVGGVAAAGYVLNATAGNCTSPGPRCPDDPQTGRRVIVIAAGTGVGAALGAWIARRLVSFR